MFDSYHKLLSIRPGLFRESFDGNETIAFELSSVNNIGSFLSTFRDNAARAKPIRCFPQLIQIKLFEILVLLLHLVPIHCLKHNNT